MSISKKIKKQNRIILKAQEKIYDLQTSCKHIETYEGKYMWAPGHINDMVICKECKKALRSIDLLELETELISDSSTFIASDSEN